MEKETTNRWRALHLRVACGETLSGEDERFYRAGMRKLEQEGGPPIGAATSARLQQLRQKIAVLEAE